MLVVSSDKAAPAEMQWNPLLQAVLPQLQELHKGTIEAAKSVKKVFVGRSLDPRQRHQVFG
jgi:hypothetical protein